jgi:nicotinamide mononucleotide transporter
MIEQLAEISALEATAVAFGVAYLVLAIRQNPWCWGAALVSVLLSLVLFFEARLYMESALQVFYAFMAVYGWQQWRHGGDHHVGVVVTTWSPRRHGVAIASIVVASAAFGYALSVSSDAALPYLDSFTTIAALVTTYMVARKILENWIYWFVIDAVSVHLYLSRGLPLYAALFVVYLVMIVIGFRRWLRDWRQQLVAVQTS